MESGEAASTFASLSPKKTLLTFWRLTPERTTVGSSSAKPTACPVRGWTTAVTKGQADGLPGARVDDRSHQGADGQAYVLVPGIAALGEGDVDRDEVAFELAAVVRGD